MAMGRTGWWALALLALAGGCAGEDDAAVQATDGQPAVAAEVPATPPAPPETAPAPQPSAEMRVEVDLAARQLRLFRRGEVVATHPVAVGSKEWPTKTGEWTITQVVWNPEWIPPTSEEWAEDEESKAPGAPDNPLGRAQLVYDPPRTIHGTNEPSSIGKAVSHGSIRVSNDVAIELGRTLMEATGAGKDDAWYQRVQSNRTEKVIVDLPQPVPIKVM